MQNFSLIQFQNLKIFDLSMVKVEKINVEDNLKVDWAKFPTLSCTLLFNSKING